jgi:hypothetical protein
VTLKPPAHTGIVSAADAPYDPQLGVVTLGRCECGYTWKQYQDGPHECPQCHPDQPKPFALRLSDREDFLGPDWVWVPWRGAFGMWAPLTDLVLVPRADFDGLLTSLTERLGEDGVAKAFEAVGTSLIAQLAEHIEHGRLRWDGDAPPAPVRDGAFVPVSPSIRRIK